MSMRTWWIPIPSTSCTHKSPQYLTSAYTCFGQSETNRERFDILSLRPLIPCRPISACCPGLPPEHLKYPRGPRSSSASHCSSVFCDQRLQLMLCNSSILPTPSGARWPLRTSIRNSSPGTPGIPTTPIPSSPPGSTEFSASPSSSPKSSSVRVDYGSSIPHGIPNLSNSTTT